MCVSGTIPTSGRCKVDQPDLKTRTRWLYIWVRVTGEVVLGISWPGWSSGFLRHGCLRVMWNTQESRGGKFSSCRSTHTHTDCEISLEMTKKIDFVKRCVQGDEFAMKINGKRKMPHNTPRRVFIRVPLVPGVPPSLLFRNDNLLSHFAVEDVEGPSPLFARSLTWHDPACVESSWTETLPKHFIPLW